MRLALVLAVAAVLVPATARADYPDPPTDRPLTTLRVTASLQIAADFWGQPLPCTVKVYAATAWQIAASMVRQPSGYEAVAATPAYDGPAPPGDCPIWVSDAFAANSVQNRILVGTALVHEEGHLLGYRHVANPVSVMNPDPPAVFGIFQRFAPHGYITTWRDSHPGEPWATRP